MINLLSNSDLEELNKTELIAAIQNLRIELDILRNAPKASALSNEELICLQQIKMLTEKSFERELDMEEAKKFEIFHKNLRMARGQVIDATDKKKVDKKLTTARLLEIAGE